MKKWISVLLVCVMAFCFGAEVSALPSQEWAEFDYRTWDKQRDIYGNRRERPAAAFTAVRWREGVGELGRTESYSGNDLYEPYPVLECYVGETLTFQDKSVSNDPGAQIVEWDWQYYGDMGEHHEFYQYNIVNQSSFTLTEPGTTTFFLCVKSDIPPRDGTLDYWSDNGNHQTLGVNKYFPNGMHWYFASVQVVVKPRPETKLYVKYWNTDTNTVFDEQTLNFGEIPEGQEQIDREFVIEEIEGYTFREWNVTLPDNTIQYSGTEDKAEISFPRWQLEKILNVEYVPTPPGGDADDGKGDTDDGKGDAGGGNGDGDGSNPPEENPPQNNGKCDGVIEWSETDSHTVKINNRLKRCYHTYHYRAVLDESHTVSPQTLKSGYGFEVTVDAEVRVELVRETGDCAKRSPNRKSEETVRPPTRSTVQLPYTVTNSLGTQGNDVRLEQAGGSSKTARFVTAPSPISPLQSRSIFTDVNLPGTKESPRTHRFDIYLSGGGVGNVEFCLRIPETFTINGDMFEDDGTTS